MTPVVGKLADLYPNPVRPKEVVPEWPNSAFSCGWASGGPCAGDEYADTGGSPTNDALRLVGAPRRVGKLRDAPAATGESVVYRACRTRPYRVM